MSSGIICAISQFSERQRLFYIDNMHCYMEVLEMYSKFEVTVGKHFYEQRVNEHVSLGRELYSECESNVRNTLSKYILPSGSIDGNMMKEEWFKTEKYDIFYLIPIKMLKR